MIVLHVPDKKMFLEGYIANDQDAFLRSLTHTLENNVNHYKQLRKHEIALQESQTGTTTSASNTTIQTDKPTNTAQQNQAQASTSAGTKVIQLTQLSKLLNAVHKVQAQVVKRDAATIWQGILEFCEKAIPANKENSRYRLTCSFLSVLTNNIPDVKAGRNWPTQMTLELIPQQIKVPANFLNVLKTAVRHVYIEFNKESEALSKLCNWMNSGLAGCIEFPQNCDIRIMVVLYVPDKKTFIGFIADDKDAFFQNIRQMYENLCKQAENQRMASQDSQTGTATSASNVTIQSDMPTSTAPQNQAQTSTSGNANKWPNRLSMQLVPVQFIKFPNLQNILSTAARRVLINFNQQSEKLSKMLLKLRSSDMNCDIRIMLVLYRPDKKIYMGFIANDQDTFWHNVVQTFENHCKQQQKQRQQQYPTSSSQQQPQPPQQLQQQHSLMSQQLPRQLPSQPPQQNILPQQLHQQRLLMSQQPTQSTTSQQLAQQQPSQPPQQNILSQQLQQQRLLMSPQPSTSQQQLPQQLPSQPPQQNILPQQLHQQRSLMSQQPTQPATSQQLAQQQQLPSKPPQQNILSQQLQQQRLLMSPQLSTSQQQLPQQLPSKPPQQNILPQQLHQQRSLMSQQPTQPATSQQQLAKQQQLPSQPPQQLQQQRFLMSQQSTQPPTSQQQPPQHQQLPSQPPQQLHQQRSLMSQQPTQPATSEQQQQLPSQPPQQNVLPQQFQQQRSLMSQQPTQPATSQQLPQQQQLPSQPQSQRKIQVSSRQKQQISQQNILHQHPKQKQHLLMSQQHLVTSQQQKQQLPLQQQQPSQLQSQEKHLLSSPHQKQQIHVQYQLSKQQQHLLMPQQPTQLLSSLHQEQQLPQQQLPSQQQFQVKQQVSSLQKQQTFQQQKHLLISQQTIQPVASQQQKLSQQLPSQQYQLKQQVSSQQKQQTSQPHILHQQQQHLLMSQQSTLLVTPQQQKQKQLPLQMPSQQQSQQKQHISCQQKQIPKQHVLHQEPKQQLTHPPTLQQQHSQHSQEQQEVSSYLQQQHVLPQQLQQEHLLTSQQQTSNQAFQTVEVEIELGHRATRKKSVSPEGFTHDWTIFVRGVEGKKICSFVKKVVFHLHESFPNPRRVVKKPPYSVSESGYAGFAVPIEVYFRSREEPKKATFEYDLYLALEPPCVNNIWVEKLIFNNPSDDFRNKLIPAVVMNSSKKNKESEEWGEYVVEKIVNKRITEEGKLQYFIKWEGFPDSDNTWEPVENVNCPDLIKAFEDSLIHPVGEKSAEGASEKKKKLDRIENTSGTVPKKKSDHAQRRMQQDPSTQAETQQPPRGKESQLQDNISQGGQKNVHDLVLKELLDLASEVLEQNKC